MIYKTNRFILQSVLLLALLLAPFYQPAVHAQALPQVSAPGAFSCSNVSEIPQAECEALVAFYNSTGGPNWVVPYAWLEDNTPCSWWEGVECLDGHVNGIVLVNAQLIGALPPEIGDLGSLHYLHLNFNQISVLPPEIGQLHGLEGLGLAGNLISSLPPEIGGLSNLQFLSVDWNRLTLLPPEIGQLQNLEDLSLAGNQIGSLPPEIGSLDSLMQLSLGNNQLVSLPPEIGQMASLKFLSVGYNQLTSLPPELGSLSLLETLDASYNRLTSLPSEIGGAGNLSKLDVSHNQITSLPAESFGVDELVASYNQIASLPAENVSWVDIDALYLDHNFLSSLPASFSVLGSAAPNYYLDLSYNLLESLPEDFGSPTSPSPQATKPAAALYPPPLPYEIIDLSHNRLSGLPGSIGNLQLTLLDLSYNRLEHLPAGFGNLRPSELNLSHNCLETGDPYLLEFLEMKDPDWQETQTVAPTHLQASPGAPDGLDLSWTPISYTLDGGYYEVSYAENPSGPFTVHGTTPDKAASSYHLDGLDAGTLYTLRVRTYTPAHGDQQNELWSSYNQVSAGFIQASPGLSQTLAYTYSGGGEVTIDIPANALTETTNVVVTLLDDLTPPDAMRFSGYGFTLQAFGAGEAPVALNWTEPFSLTIRYTPADMNGLDEAGLTLLSWDGSAWVENACGTATLLPDANQFTAPLCAPGQFGLFAPQSDYHVFLPMLSK